MDKKHCIKCDTIKIVDDFHTRIRKSGKIYVFKYCKECEKKRKQETEYVKKSLEKHKDYYQKNKDKCLERSKLYYRNNIEKVSEYQRKYHKDQKNVEKRNRRRYDRRQTDNEYRLMCNLSSRITKLLESKSIRTNKLIGCSPAFLKKWIEWQFDSNMSWNNYGTYWHVDHVIPCNSFDLINLDEQHKCFNWTNCRPLEKIKNIKKNDNIILFQILLQELKVYYYINHLQHDQIAGKS